MWRAGAAVWRAGAAVWRAGAAVWRPMPMPMPMPMSVVAGRHGEMRFLYDRRMVRESVE
jgi:hypothetical protein